MRRFYLLSVLCITLHFQPAAAEERLHLDKTTILGNRELPKVTFVVPWADAAADVPQWQAVPKVRPAAVPLDGELYHRQAEYLKQRNYGGDAAKPGVKAR